MTNERIKRMLTLLATLAAAAIFATGCGGDDNDDNGDGGVGGNVGAETTEQSDATDVPDSKDEAVDRCFEEADKLDGDAKEQARKVCEAAEKGEVPDVDLKDAKTRCLEGAEHVPDDAQREQAKNACELIE
jgi:hypothetical protein